MDHATDHLLPPLPPDILAALTAPPVVHDPSLLRGRSLRRAALAVLLRAGRPLQVGEVLTAIEAWGRRVDAEYPRKALADALAYEHDRGWARRVRRGTYAVGTISKTSRWRVLRQLE